MTQTRRGFFKGTLATALASQALASPVPGLAENSQEQRTNARASSTARDAPVGIASQAAGKNYEATWESLAKRLTPACARKHEGAIALDVSTP